MFFSGFLNSASYRSNTERFERDMPDMCPAWQTNKQKNKKKTPRFKQACQKKLRFRVSLKSERKQQRYGCAVLWLVEKTRNPKNRPRGSNRLAKRSLNPEFRWNRSVNARMAADLVKILGSDRQNRPLAAQWLVEKKTLPSESWPDRRETGTRRQKCVLCSDWLSRNLHFSLFDYLVVLTTFD